VTTAISWCCSTTHIVFAVYYLDLNDVPDIPCVEEKPATSPSSSPPSIQAGLIERADLVNK